MAGPLDPSWVTAMLKVLSVVAEHAMRVFYNIQRIQGVGVEGYAVVHQFLDEDTTLCPNRPVYLGVA
jgi:hypothetical protein